MTDGGHGTDETRRNPARGSVRPSDVVGSSVNRYIYAQMQRAAAATEEEPSGDEPAVDTDGPPETEVARLTASMDDLRSIVETVASEVNEIQDRLAASAEAESTIVESIDQLRADLAARGGTDETAQPEIGTSLESMRTEIASLRSTAEDIETDVAELHEAIGGAAEVTDVDETSEPENGPAVPSLTDQFDALSETIDRIDADQQEQSAFVREELSALRGRMRRLEDNQEERTLLLETLFAPQQLGTRDDAPTSTEEMVERIQSLSTRLEDLQQKSANGRHEPRI